LVLPREPVQPYLCATGENEPGFRAHDVGINMIGRMIAVAAVAACGFATIAVQPSDAATTDRASRAEQVREFARAHSAANGPGLQAASVVTPSATSCLHEAYTDPSGDGGAIDVTSYSIDYVCTSKIVVVEATSPGEDAEALTDGLWMYIDRDHNTATGCLGDDVMVFAGWDDTEFLGIAVNTPKCSESTWSARSEVVAAAFPESDTIGLAFPYSVIGKGSFGWWLGWGDITDDGDVFPNAGYRTTLLPGTPALQFRTAQYNAPGTDTNKNSSLNNEWISIRNYGPTTKNLKGYSVRDAQNNVYTFKTDFSLAPDKYVRIHTGKGTNTATDRYWGRTTHVWGNTTDTATLRKPDKATNDTCRWTTAGTGSRICGI
jgi:hypothetical protein